MKAIFVALTLVLFASGICAACDEKMVELDDSWQIVINDSHCWYLDIYTDAGICSIRLDQLAPWVVLRRV